MFFSSQVNFTNFVKVKHAYQYVLYNSTWMTNTLIKNQNTLIFTQSDNQGSMVILGELNCTLFPNINDYHDIIKYFEKLNNLTPQSWSIYSTDNLYCVSKDELSNVDNHYSTLPFLVPSEYLLRSQNIFSNYYLNYAAPVIHEYPSSIIRFLPWIMFLFENNKSSYEANQSLDILLGPDSLIGIYWDKNVLIGLQDVPFKTPNDIIYQVFSMKRMWCIDENSIIFLKGFVHSESEMINQLKAYFPNIYINNLLV